MYMLRNTVAYVPWGAAAVCVYFLKNQFPKTYFHDPKHVQCVFLTLITAQLLASREPKQLQEVQSKHSRAAKRAELHQNDQERSCVCYDLQFCFISDCTASEQQGTMWSKDKVLPKAKE